MYKQTQEIMRFCEHPFTLWWQKIPARVSDKTATVLIFLHSFFSYLLHENLHEKNLPIFILTSLLWNPLSHLSPVSLFLRNATQTSTLIFYLHCTGKNTQNKLLRFWHKNQCLFKLFRHALQCNYLSTTGHSDLGSNFELSRKKSFVRVLIILCIICSCNAKSYLIFTKKKPYKK